MRWNSWKLSFNEFTRFFCCAFNLGGNFFLFDLLFFLCVFAFFFNSFLLLFLNLLWQSLARYFHLFNIFCLDKNAMRKLLNFLLLDCLYQFSLLLLKLSDFNLSILQLNFQVLLFLKEFSSWLLKLLLEFWNKLLVN